MTTYTIPGTYSITLLQLGDASDTFVGPGIYNVATVLNLLGTSTLTATNGAILNINVIAGAITGTNLVISGASTISIASTISLLSPISADFTGGGGGTVIFEPGLLGLLNGVPTITGFGTGDHIDFGTSLLATGDKTVYSASTHLLTLETSGGATVGQVKMVGHYTAADFVVGKEGIDYACFLAGTNIMTPDGQVPVDSLAAGDLVMTLFNGAVNVKAVRRRSFSVAESSGPKVRPVCIGAGALGEQAPIRDLYVSPDHSMFVDGVLVPAHLLVNGQTITQPFGAGQVDYYHVEIEPHDILIAEGAASESYLDIGNRGHFGQPGVIALFAATEPKNWEDACAKLVLAGPELAAIQARLLARAMLPSETREALAQVA